MDAAKVALAGKFIALNAYIGKEKQSVYWQMNRWRNYDIRTNSRILFSLKKKKILSFATTWMTLEDIMLSEIRCVSHLCAESKKIHRHRQWLPGVGRGKKQGDVCQ